MFVMSHDGRSIAECISRDENITCFHEGGAVNLKEIFGNIHEALGDV